MTIYRCRDCGELRNGERRCGICGEARELQSDSIEVRKHVVVCFVDIVSSTSLGHRLDAESLREFLARYFGEVSAVFRKHGGTVEKFIGDAVMAVFGVPTAREDDATRALLAAAEIHAAVAAISADLSAEYGEKLEVRIGVNGGEVFVDRHLDGEWAVTGDVVNVAARLEQAAGPGETLVSGTIPELAGHAARLAAVADLYVRGKPTALPTWRMEDVTARTRHVGDHRLAGRGRELASLHRAADRVIGHGESWLVSIKATAGMGKSHLVREFLAQRRDYVVLEAVCPSFNADSTFWPLRAILEQLAEDWRAYLRALFGSSPEADPIIRRLATAIGESMAQTSITDIAWALRRVVEKCADRNPVALVVEDLQRAQPAFVDLLRQFTEGLGTARVLVIFTYRPELGRLEPVNSRTRTLRLELTALDDAAMREMIEDLAADTGQRSRRERSDSANIMAASEGNPLILKQLFEISAADANIPAGVRTLFEAQLDRLLPVERLLCECGAVVGAEFWADAVCFVAGTDSVPVEEYSAALLRLREIDIIRRLPSWNSGRPDHRFSHSMLMETIYSTMPKRRRSWIHHRIATWLESASFLGADERSTLIAMHLERAHTMTAAVAPRGRHTAFLASRASAAAIAAAEGCFVRGDLQAGIRLLTTGQQLLPPGDERHRDAARHLIDSELALGELEAALAGLERASAALPGDAVWAAMEPVGRALIALRSAPGTVDAGQVADEAIRRAALLDEPGALIWAGELATLGHVASLRFAAAERQLRACWDQAERAHDERARLRMMCGLCEIAFWGPAHVRSGLELCDRVLPAVKADHQLAISVLAVKAGLLALAGEAEEAAGCITDSRQGAADLGMPQVWGAARQYHALIMLLADRPRAAAAEFALMAGEHELTQPVKETARVWSARASLIAGDRGAAERVLGWPGVAAAAPATGCDSYYMAMWLGVAGRLAAMDADLAAAADWACQAVTISRAEDNPSGAANALVDMAFVHRMSGDEAAAARSLDAARELFARRGAARCVELTAKWATVPSEAVRDVAP